MNPIIEAEDLKKSYGSTAAVKGISFYVESGKLFAFLGPNGAGKSTTIDMICTFLKPDSGIVSVNGFLLGKQNDKIRSSIGAVFQDSLLDQLLTVKENMTCRGALYGLGGKALDTAIQRSMAWTGVLEYAGRPYGKLSGGQRRRCDIARALIHTPKILFLDEPTTGLDPQTRKVVWETIQRLQKEMGMTVFLTTHYMEEAANADYVMVMDEGRISAKGTPHFLRSTYAADKLVMTGKDLKPLTDILDNLGYSHAARNGQITVKIDDTLGALPVLEKCRPLIEGFEVTNGTMDEAFIKITGKELRQ